MVRIEIEEWEGVRCRRLARVIDLGLLRERELYQGVRDSWIVMVEYSNIAHEFDAAKEQEKAPA